MMQTRQTGLHVRTKEEIRNKIGREIFLRDIPSTPWICFDLLIESKYGYVFGPKAN